MHHSARSPVVQEVSDELQRVVERWRQLPLDHALSYVPRVRALVQSLADEVAQRTGAPPQKIPDCGPATLMDQLTVLVYDASAVTTGTTGAGLPSVTPARTPSLAEDLAHLRRELVPAG